MRNIVLCEVSINNKPSLHNSVNWESQSAKGIFDPTESNKWYKKGSKGVLRHLQSPLN